PGAGPLPTGPAAAAAAPGDAPAEIEAGKIGGAAPGGRTAVLVGYGPKTAAAVRRQRKTVNGTAPQSPPPPAATTQTHHAPPARARTAPARTAPALASPAGAAPAHAAPAHAAPAGAQPAAATGANPTGVLAKPPVRKLARDLGVDLGQLVGTGPAGSITRADVQLAVSARETAGVSAPTTAAAVFDASRERRVPVKGVRRLTADNMVASAFTAPHVTVFLQVDVTRAMKSLDRLKTRPEWRELRISPLLLVAKAVLLATRRHPMLNSSWSALADGTAEIVVKDYVNLGIAAATERGLIVPNIKDAGRLSLRELAEAMTTLVTTAKSGRTSAADMSGGTFTITNVGVFGIDSGTPILPPGETAILAFGAIRPTPWVHRGKIKIRQVTTLGLSFDHRVVDGESGSRFLRDVGDFLTDPEGALLSWT
ncbi:MAG TPA: dihydrolipoamide acetyltransferase family protein, partial [Actinoplanes sp.]|nr:dihydrolipoamide acetyltransferase family protein [Actinoplanes sp.]